MQNIVNSNFETTKAVSVFIEKQELKLIRKANAKQLKK